MKKRVEYPAIITAYYIPSPRLPVMVILSNGISTPSPTAAQSDKSSWKMAMFSTALAPLDAVVVVVKLVLIAGRTVGSISRLPALDNCGDDPIYEKGSTYIHRTMGMSCVYTFIMGIQALNL